MMLIRQHSHHQMNLIDTYNISECSWLAILLLLDYVRHLAKFVDVPISSLSDLPRKYLENHATSSIIQQ